MLDTGTSTSSCGNCSTVINICACCGTRTRETVKYTHRVGESYLLCDKCHTIVKSIAAFRIGYSPALRFLLSLEREA